MPPTIAQSISRLEAAFPLSKAAAWDSVGLQIGDPDAAAGRIAVCHEVTSAVVEMVLDGDIDLLIAYHPLIFGSASSFVAGDSVSGRAYRLAAGGAALYVVHTAFDVVAGGAADALAAALELENVTGFGPNWPGDSSKVVTFVPAEGAAAVAAAMAAAGAGIVGKYTECAFSIEGTGTFRPGPGAQPVLGEPGEAARAAEVRIELNTSAAGVDRVVAALVAAHPYEEPAFDVYPLRANAGFVGRIGEVAATPLGTFALETVAGALGATVRYAGDRALPVQRIAVVPGSGSGLIGDAAAVGADVIVTGDVSHHRANEALSRGVAVVDAGHAATERPGVARLYSLVLNMFDEVIDLTHIDPSPWGSG